MGDVQREMPKYRCHKVVHALKIKHVVPATDGSAAITPEDEGYAPFDVAADYVAKHAPAAGGYYVVYENGYESWSPAEAFEAGYARF